TDSGINLRKVDEHTLSITLDETTEDLGDLLEVFGAAPVVSTADSIETRTTAFLTHPVFNRYHTEHEMLRYLRRLEAKDLSLTFSMIPLGSCTMKLNATSAMLPVTWPEFGSIHPSGAGAQTEGHAAMSRQLGGWLAEITGFAGV